MKKLIVNISLPATLFITFANTDFHRQYVALIAIVLCLCSHAVCGDRVGRSVLPITRFIRRFLCIQAGMMGYAHLQFLQEELFKFTVIDIGQVVFVFLVTFYLQKKTGSRRQRIMKGNIPCNTGNIFWCLYECERRVSLGHQVLGLRGCKIHVGDIRGNDAATHMYRYWL